MKENFNTISRPFGHLFGLVWRPWPGTQRFPAFSGWLSSIFQMPVSLQKPLADTAGNSNNLLKGNIK